MNSLKTTGCNNEVLIFQGIGDRLKDFAQKSESSIHLFAPYITYAGLKHVLHGNNMNINISIFTTWTENDISYGSSDPEIYPLIRSNGGRLFLIENLHLKGLLNDLRSFFLTTANITKNGLSLQGEGNLECATIVEPLSPLSLLEFYKLIGSAIPVNDAMYEDAKAIQRQTNEGPSGQDFFKTSLKTEYLVSKLPCTNTPDILISRLSDIRDSKLDFNEVELINIYHDAALFGLRINNSRLENLNILKAHFIKQPFVSLYEKSLRERPRFFGETKAWIHAKCTDDPTPHRRELTDRIKNLFSWFSLLYPESYRVSQPNYSQMLEYIDKG